MGGLDMYYLNLGSLILGLLAWIFPIVSLAKQNKAGHKNWVIYSVLSIISCAISLFFQIVYQNHLVRKEDWSAIADTSGALVLVSSVLLSVVIVLNVIVLIQYRKFQEKNG